LIVKASIAISLYLVLSLVVVGCGGSANANCNVSTLTISPQSAVISHTATSPGNQQQFMAGFTLPSGCTPPPIPFNFVTWSVSDTVNVSISNTNDQTYGTATCIGATAGPVNVTATTNDGRLTGGGTASGAATLTCN